MNNKTFGIIFIILSIVMIFPTFAIGGLLFFDGFFMAWWVPLYLLFLLLIGPGLFASVGYAFFRLKRWIFIPLTLAILPLGYLALMFAMILFTSISNHLSAKAQGMATRPLALAFILPAIITVIVILFIYAYIHALKHRSEFSN